MKSEISLWVRMAAVCYDILAIFSLVFFLFFVAVFLLPDATRKLEHTLFYLITLPAIFAYFVFSWIFGGQTIGARAWRFRVVSENDEALGFKTAILRAAVGFLSLAFFGLGFFYQLFDGKNRTFHDRICNTRLKKIYPSGKKNERENHKTGGFLRRNFLTFALFVVLADLSRQNFWIHDFPNSLNIRAQKIAEIQTEIDFLMADNQILQQKLRAISDPEMVESVARFRLGMVKKGEHFYQTMR